MKNNGSNFKFGIKELVIIAGLMLVILFAIWNWNDIYTILSKKEQLISGIRSYGNWGFLIFVLIQILQVVVFIIPGEVVYFAGGYLYGTFISSVLSIIGITLGSLICFQAARVIGQPFVAQILSAEKMDKLKSMINTPKASITLFLIFLMPGLPGKDALAYAAGLTPIKFFNFFIVTLIARSPWIIAASFWGANLGKGNYTVLAITTVLAAIVFLFGIFKGEKLINMYRRKNPL